MSSPVDESVPDLLKNLNALRGGWNAAMGITFVAASAEEVVAELEVQPIHQQPYGIVHGGVHAGVIETLASTGAAISAGARGQTVVGLENSTSFVRAVRGGKLRARATPVTRGRRTQVWQTVVTDEQDRVVATGRVRLLCLDEGMALDGEKVGLKGD
jgi:uncharacterized protein (TIGR00369 family)